MTHFSNYQSRDHEVVDYHIYELPSTGLRFRGPQHASLPPGGYIVCLGAAQTFGCLCEHPFPVLLSNLTQLPVLNLGYGGAGPAFFTCHKALHPYISNARLAVVQVMSARSVSNSLFAANGLEYLTVRKTNRCIGAEQAWREFIDSSMPLARMQLPWPMNSIVSRFSNHLRMSRIRRLVSETRRNWVKDYIHFFNSIKIPTIFFWFSRRTPDYAQGYKDVWSLFGEFPQLVNSNMVNTVAKYATRYVECVTSEGTPHILRSRFTGELVAVDPAKDRADLGGHLIAEDSYYPSPEMHRTAANLLAQFCC